MKILILSTWDTYGGAARAAFRLHEALLQNGIDSTMLVDDSKSDLNTVVTLQNKNLCEKIFKKLNKIMRMFSDKLSLVKYEKTMTKKFGTFSPQIISNKKLVNRINEINPDIVHLHWICGGFLSIENIAEIKAPIVWSLHDMWAFTGGCHTVAEQTRTYGVDDMPLCCEMCEKYAENCGNCPLLGSKKTKDLSFSVLQRKKKSFAKAANMTIVGVSGWMANCAKKSAVFVARKSVVLPNPLDTKIFKPIPKDVCRELWNLPKNKKLVLFGSILATSTPYKGYDKLLETLNKIKTKNVECVVFGSREPKDPPKIPQKIHYIERLLFSTYFTCTRNMPAKGRREEVESLVSPVFLLGTFENNTIAFFRYSRSNFNSAQKILIYLLCRVGA